MDLVRWRMIGHADGPKWWRMMRDLCQRYLKSCGAKSTIPGKDNGRTHGKFDGRAWKPLMESSSVWAWKLMESLVVESWKPSKEGLFSLGLKTESVNVSERSMADGIRGVSKRDSAGSMRAWVRLGWQEILACPGWTWLKTELLRKDSWRIRTLDFP